MNRVVKFRAFDKVKNEWLDSESLIFSHGCWFEDFRALEDYVALNVDEGEVVIVQFTGLHDKNGKEIYEGDIVNVNRYGGTPRLEQVQFYTTGSGFAAIHPFQDDGYHWSANHCEILGNTYEHPHLLKGVK